MSLASLAVTDLRCLGAAALEFGQGLNLIHGPNGSGKTSILEAVFLVGRGRSFRTHQTNQLIARARPSFTVFAQTMDPVHRIGFEYRRDEAYVARLDGCDVRSLAELPSAFFVEVIDPEIHRLIEGVPRERRRWLDWGVFHVEHSFLEHWLRFSRALRQRNASLKAGSDPRVWDGELVAHGEQIAIQRAHWFDAVKPSLVQTIHRISGLDVELSYHRGWPAERTLADVISEGLERDELRGSTFSGPQRADVMLKIGGKAARESLSRGQQKLVASAMVLALLGQLREKVGTPPTLLLDDPGAELDLGRLGSLVEAVRELKCQLVVTSLDPDLRSFGEPDRVFHVEQGTVQRL